MTLDHAAWMRLAIAEGELARGSTGDNPWVGCVIVSASGELLARGRTQGPGEDHAEIVAANEARLAGRSIVGATLYSTLEPCSFHGRTPACAQVIVREKLGRVVIAMRDPHPRVDGEGLRILHDAAIETIEGICEAEVRRQLGTWVITHHPHDVIRRAATLPANEREAHLAEIYSTDPDTIRELLNNTTRTRD